MRQRNSRRRARAARSAGGIALVELLIGVLLAAAVTAGAFAASLSSQIALRKSDSRAQADAAGKVILDILSNYQVPDPFVNNIPVTWAPVLPGTSTQCWSIPAPPPASPGTCQTGVSEQWALNYGTHNAGGLLPVELQAEGWTASYDVTPGPGGARMIEVQVAWPNESNGI